MAEPERPVLTMSNDRMRELIGHIHHRTPYTWTGALHRHLAEIPDWYRNKYDFFVLDSIFEDVMRITPNHPEAELWLMLNAESL